MTRIVAIASPEFAPLALLDAPHPASGHPLPASRGEGSRRRDPSPRLRGEGARSADEGRPQLFASNDLPTLRREVPTANVLLIAPRYGHLLRELWPDAKNVRWVHMLSAGVEPVLFDELRDSDVPLTNGRGVFADALGEFAIGAMLWFAKDFARMRRNQSAHVWAPFNVERIEGRTAGIVGYGAIGRAVGGRAEGLGMKVTSARRREGDVDEVIASADYLVVCAPLTESTRGLIDATRIARMKPTAVLINISRGPVVDEAALIEALATNLIRGAALDVFDVEPLPPDHPLWSLDNVLLSPHCADHTPDSHERAMRFFIENLARFERGQKLQNIVDKAAGY